MRNPVWFCGHKTSLAAGRADPPPYSPSDTLATLQWDVFYPHQAPGGREAEERRCVLQADAFFLVWSNAGPSEFSTAAAKAAALLAANESQRPEFIPCAMTFTSTGQTMRYPIGLKAPPLRVIIIDPSCPLSPHRPCGTAAQGDGGKQDLLSALTASAATFVRSPVLISPTDAADGATYTVIAVQKALACTVVGQRRDQCVVFTPSTAAEVREIQDGCVAFKNAEIESAAASFTTDAASVLECAVQKKRRPAESASSPACLSSVSEQALVGVTVLAAQGRPMPDFGTTREALRSKYRAAPIDIPLGVSPCVSSADGDGNDSVRCSVKRTLLPSVLDGKSGAVLTADLSALESLQQHTKHEAVVSSTAYSSYIMRAPLKSSWENTRRSQERDSCRNNVVVADTSNITTTAPCTDHLYVLRLDCTAGDPRVVSTAQAIIARCGRQEPQETSALIPCHVVSFGRRHSAGWVAAIRPHRSAATTLEALDLVMSIPDVEDAHAVLLADAPWFPLVAPFRSPTAAGAPAPPSVNEGGHHEPERLPSVVLSLASVFGDDARGLSAVVVSRLPRGALSRTVASTLSLRVFGSNAPGATDADVLCQRWAAWVSSALDIPTAHSTERRDGACDNSSVEVTTAGTFSWLHPRAVGLVAYGVMCEAFGEIDPFLGTLLEYDIPCPESPAKRASKTLLLDRLKSLHAIHTKVTAGGFRAAGGAPAVESRCGKAMTPWTLCVAGCAEAESAAWGHAPKECDVFARAVYRSNNKLFRVTVDPSSSSAPALEPKDRLHRAMAMRDAVQTLVKVASTPEAFCAADGAVNLLPRRGVRFLGYQLGPSQRHRRPSYTTKRSYGTQQGIDRGVALPPSCVLCPRTYGLLRVVADGTCRVAKQQKAHLASDQGHPADSQNLSLQRAAQELHCLLLCVQRYSAVFTEEFVFWVTMRVAEEAPSHSTRPSNLAASMASPTAVHASGTARILGLLAEYFPPFTVGDEQWMSKVLSIATTRRPTDKPRSTFLSGDDAVAHLGMCWQHHFLFGILLDVAPRAQPSTAFDTACTGSDHAPHPLHVDVSLVVLATSLTHRYRNVTETEAHRVAVRDLLMSMAASIEQAVADGVPFHTAKAEHRAKLLSALRRLRAAAMPSTRRTPFTNPMRQPLSKTFDRIRFPREPLWDWCVPAKGKDATTDSLVEDLIAGLDCISSNVNLDGRSTCSVSFAESLAAATPALATLCQAPCRNWSTGRPEIAEARCIAAAAAVEMDPPSSLASLLQGSFGAWVPTPSVQLRCFNIPRGSTGIGNARRGFGLLARTARMAVTRHGIVRPDVVSGLCPEALDRGLFSAAHTEALIAALEPFGWGPDLGPLLGRPDHLTLGTLKRCGTAVHIASFMRAKGLPPPVAWTVMEFIR